MSGIIAVSIALLMVFLGVVHHEYGHMHAADKRRVRVSEFAVGMGPKLFSHVSKKNGRRYSLRLIPMGGYCDIDDQDLYAASTKDHIAILSAGFIRNFIDGSLLILAGRFIITGFVSFKQTFENLALVGETIISTIGATFMGLAHFFDFKLFAEQGGVASSVGSMSSFITEMNPSYVHAIGIGLIIGGMLNITLAVFNALPIPVIDGGQIVTRLICNGIKKYGHREPNMTLVAKVNALFLGLLLMYQGIFFLFDVPEVREFVLRLFG